MADSRDVKREIRTEARVHDVCEGVRMACELVDYHGRASLSTIEAERSRKRISVFEEADLFEYSAED